MSCEELPDEDLIFFDVTLRNTTNDGFAHWSAPAVPLATGPNSFTITATDRATPPNTTTITRTIHLTTATADSDGDGLSDVWEAGHGLDPFSDDAENGTSGDGDRDGLGNLLELALGLDPRQADATGALTATIETNPYDGEPYLVIRHRRLLAPGALSYRLEISSDLGEWHAVTAAESEELAPPAPNPDGLTETVAIRLLPSVTAPGNEVRHVRLRVSTP